VKFTAQASLTPDSESEGNMLFTTGGTQALAACAG
jgi:hypothetical protein